MTEQKARRGRLANAVIIGLIAVLAPVLVVGFIYWQTGELPQFQASGPPQMPPPGTLETVVIPANSTAPVVTAADYAAGDYRLVVEGVLPIDDTRLIDAYYLHTDDFGLALDAPQPIESPLRVAGESLTALGERPAYDSFHIYRLDYAHVGGRLSFSLDADRVPPEAGPALRVYVTQPSSAGS